MQYLKASAPIRSEYHALVRSDIFPLVDQPRGTLLDVGGGVGATAAALKADGRVQRAGVIDLVAQEAAEVGLDFHVSANLEEAGAMEAAVSHEGPFSVILALDVLEHLSDPWSVVARLHRLLAPGGIIVASIPNIRYYQASFPLFFRGRWMLTDAGILDRTHLRWFVRDTAIELMTSSGLVLDTVVDKPGGGRKIKLIRAFTFGIGSTFTDLQYLIRVKNVDHN